MKLPRFSLILCCVISCISSLVAGCSSLTATQPAGSAACDPGDRLLYTDVNLHPEFQAKQADDIVNEISARAWNNRNDPNALLAAKQDALIFLEHETRRWSDVEYLVLADEPPIRVIVTLISPSLVRAVVLMDWLHDLEMNDLTADFRAELNESLGKFEQRKTIPFFLLVQTNSTPVKAISLHPTDIVLASSALPRVTTSHSEPFLNLDFNSSNIVQSGFFFYPANVSILNACIPVLDSTSGTSIVLNNNVVSIGEKPNNPMTWKIQFPILANLNDSVFGSGNSLQFTTTDLDIKAAPMPPDVFNLGNPQFDNVNFIALGKFIWRSLVIGGLP